METRKYSDALAPLIKNKLLGEVGRTGFSIVLVYSTHYGAAKLYNAVCVPDGFLGYVFGFVTTASPWCKLILDTMKVTENQYSTMVLIILSRLIIQALGI